MNVFERFPKITLILVLSLLGWGGFYGLEWMAQRFFGLGNVVLYTAHPLYGYRPQPNQVVTRDRHTVITINNLGLRADQNWEHNAPRHKILFLGDSVTYGGSYIHNDALFSHLVSQALPGWSSANAGVNGWGVSNVRAFIESQDFLPADVYVSVFPEGDFYRGVNRIGGQPFWTRAPRYALEELLQYGVYLLHLKKMPTDYFYDKDLRQKEIIASHAVDDLKALDDYFKANNKRHYIYISPSKQQVLGQAPLDDTIQSLLAKNNLQANYIVNSLPMTCDCEKAQWFHDNIHLSAAGHQQWANIIANDLVKGNA